LGETILVAPIIEEGATSRDVVLPSGSWKDGNDGTVYEGPQTLKDYSAPIDVLPYFIKQ
jgi:alpha-glucosidase (family GH31 glycosyl hydrolase)